MGFLDYVTGDRQSMFVPPSTYLYFDSEDVTVFITDEGGTILSHDEWFQLRDMIDSFYRVTTINEVSDANQANKERWERERESRVAHVERNGPDRSGCVYMISDGRFIKIGRSRKPTSRIKDLQASTSGAVLTLLHTIQFPNPAEPEAFLHVRFHSRRVKGEWFDLQPDQIEWFKSQTSDSLLELVAKGVPSNERTTSWQGLAKQLRRDFETGGGVLGRHSQ